MRVSHEILLLFGDQTTQIAPAIKQLAHQSKRYLFLQILFRDGTEALHRELSGLQPTERRKFSSFDSILELSEIYAKNGVLDAAVSTVLLCIAQLGFLVMFVFLPRRNQYTAKACPAFSLIENNPWILTSTASRVSLAGLCTGLIPAAAVASAKSISDVLEMAPELICISMRLGLAASRRSMQLERSSESWATAVPAVPVHELQKELDEFHGNKAGFE